MVNDRGNRNKVNAVEKAVQARKGKMEMRREVKESMSRKEMSPVPCALPRQDGYQGRLPKENAMSTILYMLNSKIGVQYALPVPDVMISIVVFQWKIKKAEVLQFRWTIAS